MSLSKSLSYIFDFKVIMKNQGTDRLNKLSGALLKNIYIPII